MAKGFDIPSDAKLVALKIENAVTTLVPTTAVTRRLAARIVTATSTLARVQQALLGCRLCNRVEHRARLLPLRGRHRF